MMHHIIRVIERPTPAQVLRASCGITTNLAIGYEVQLAHYGEDGPQFVLADLRGPMFIGYEQAAWGELQDWASLELINAFWHEINEPKEQS